MLLKADYKPIMFKATMNSQKSALMLSGGLVIYSNNKKRVFTVKVNAWNN